MSAGSDYTARYGAAVMNTFGTPRREFVRGVYWRDMPGLAAANHFGHHGQLPKWYWTGDTDMRCMRAVVGQTLVDAPTDEHRALDREISAYARAHLGFEACVPLDPPDCNDVLTVHLTGGDYAQGHYGGKDCHTPEFHTCVKTTTRQHPFVTATRGTKWTATLSLLRLVEDPTAGPSKRVSP